jgi:hypothetical protein
MNHVLHINVDDEIFKAFHDYQRENNYPSAKIAFCNMIEITQRTSKNYMTVRHETRGRKPQSLKNSTISSVERQ